MSDDFDVTLDGVRLAGRFTGAGDPLLLLHGGPGLGFDYLEPLVPELEDGFRVARYQQRGLQPSQTEGPFAVADHVSDARRVLDGLGWESAVVVGHSWGGHLALHVAVAMPDRVSALLVIDPLGGVGDGGAAEFEAEIWARTPEQSRARAQELDKLAMGRGASPDELQESLRLVWPAYFPSPDLAPPMPHTEIAEVGYGETWESIRGELPRLEAALPGIEVPVGFVAGERSPIPVSTSVDTAERIPGAWVDVVAGAGHFVWLDREGAVRSALARLRAG